VIGKTGVRKLIAALGAGLVAAVATSALAGSAAFAKNHGKAPPIRASSQCTGSSKVVSHAVPWAQQLLRADRVWGLTRGAGQIVAVLDSGVSATAPALSGAVLPGLNVLTSRAGDADCIGHGTFVAGLIAGHLTPGTGFSGLAPQARILPVDVTGGNQNDAATSAALAAGIRYAVNSGATVIDVSAATTPGPSSALRAAVTYATARNVVVIAPVGANSQTQANELSYPASYPGVIAVSAVDPSGAPLATGTSGVRVDLAAPGSAVVSIGPHGPGQLTGSGAAVATGFVAGTTALVRSYYPRLSAVQVAHRLEVTADAPGVTLPDRQLGYGIVDPYTAVTTVLPQESGGLPPPVPSARPLHRPTRPVPDPWPEIAPLIVAVIVGAGIAAAFTARSIMREGKRRRWRSMES